MNLGDFSLINEKGKWFRTLFPQTRIHVGVFVLSSVRACVSVCLSMMFVWKLFRSRLSPTFLGGRLSFLKLFIIGLLSCKLLGHSPISASHLESAC